MNIEENNSWNELFAFNDQVRTIAFPLMFEVFHFIDDVNYRELFNGNEIFIE